MGLCVLVAWIERHYFLRARLFSLSRGASDNLSIDVSGDYK